MGMDQPQRPFSRCALVTAVTPIILTAWQRLDGYELSIRLRILPTAADKLLR